MSSLEQARAVAAQIGYPVVLKPRGLAGSMGVILVATAADLDAGFATAHTPWYPGVPTYEDGVLVESYLDGPEISIDGALVDGRYVPLFVAHKQLSEHPYFQETGHVVDADDPLLRSPELLDMLAAAHRALGLRRGMTHAEVRLTSAGPRIVEINARLGGDLIPYVGMLATGIDPARVAADVVLGREPEVAMTRSAVAEIRFLYPHEDLVVRGVEVPAPGSIAGLHLAQATAREGAVLRLPPRGYLARYAQLICVAGDREPRGAPPTAPAAAVRLSWAPRARLRGRPPRPVLDRRRDPRCRRRVMSAQPANVLTSVRESDPAVRWLLCGVFVNQLGAFVQVFLVLFLVDQGSSDARAGIALGAYGAGSVLGALLGGRLADRLGRRATMTVSMLCAAALTIAIGFLGDPALYPLLLLVVVADGAMTQAYRPAASAMLADLVPAERLVMTFSMYRVALNTGAVIGPLVAAWLMTVSWDLLFWADGLTAIACALLARRFLPASDAAPAAAHAASAAGASSAGTADRAASPAAGRTGYAAVLRDGRYLLYLFAMFASAVIYMQYFAVLPLEIRADGHSAAIYSAVLALSAAVVITCELLVTKRVQAWRATSAAAGGIALLGIGLGAYGIEGGLVLLFAATPRRRPRPDRQRPDDVRPPGPRRTVRRARQLRRRVAGDVRARRRDRPRARRARLRRARQRRVGRVRRRRRARRARRAVRRPRARAGTAPSPRLDLARPPRPLEPHREPPPDPARRLLARLAGGARRGGRD